MRKVSIRPRFDPRFAGAVQEDDAQRQPQPAEAVGNHHEVRAPEAGKKMEVNEVKELKEVKENNRRVTLFSPILPLLPSYPLLPFICLPQFRRWLRCNARRLWDSECSLPRAWRSSSSVRTSCRQLAARSLRGRARLPSGILPSPR